MDKLSIDHKGRTYVLDDFFKSIVFQYIMDTDYIDRDERDILLMIFRKTIHFNKWEDHLGVYWLSKNIGMGQDKLRRTIRSMEKKGVITVHYSKGGRVAHEKKFHRFSMHKKYVNKILEIWILSKQYQQLPVIV